VSASNGGNGGLLSMALPFDRGELIGG